MILKFSPFPLRIAAAYAAALLLFVSCSESKSDKVAHAETFSVLQGELTAHAKSVYLSEDEKGDPVICWSEEDTLTEKKRVYFSIFQAGNFSEITAIPVEENIKLHPEGMPKIAFKTSGEILAFYEVCLPTETNQRAGNVRYIVSSNRGKTWSSPRNVHSDSTPGKSHSFFDVTRLKNGEIGCIWLDTSIVGSGRPVLFAQTDSLHRFTAETIVDSFACQCCRLALYAGKSGAIHAMYRDIINDSIRDISVSTSTDNGNTFSQPICFSGDNWNIDGCPHNGPDVVSDKKNIYATWFTGAKETGVYYAELSHTGELKRKTKISAAGVYIQLALGNDKKLLVFNERDENHLSSIAAVVLPEETRVTLTTTPSDATLPVVQPIPAGNSFLVAWIQEKKIFYKILETGLSPTTSLPTR